MRSLKFVIPGIVLALAATILYAGETVSHPRLGLRLAVPDGFVQNPTLVQGQVVYAFQRPPASGQQVGTGILVSRLGGVLGRDKLDPRLVASKGPQISVITEKWKGFDIEVIRVSEQAGELQLLTFNAQVPLRPEAVQVGVFGEAGRENELRGVLQSVLSNLDGQTNWLNTEQRVARLAGGIVWITITTTITIGVLAVVSVIIWRVVRGRGKARDLA